MGSHAAVHTNHVGVASHLAQGLKNQQWIMDPAKGTIQFAADPTMCLDNLGGSTAPGNRIGIWECEAGDDSQQWSYDSVARALNLTSNAGVCLDLPGGTPTNGNWLEVWGCTHHLPTHHPRALPSTALLCISRGATRENAAELAAGRCVQVMG